MNSKIIRLLSTLLVAILIFNILPVSQINADSNEDGLSRPFSESELKNSLNKELEEQNITVEDIDFTNENDSVTVEAATTDDEIGVVEARFEIEPGTNQFNLFITEEGTKKKYSVDIFKLSEETIKGSITDVATGEVYDLDSTKGQASIAFVIPVGIAMSEALLAALFTTGAMIIAGGVAYVVATKAKKSKKYNHFRAIVRGGSVYIGGGLSRSKAISRMKGRNDVYSVSKNQAKAVAAGANRNGQPIHEVDRKNGKPKKGYYYHWHPYKRTPKAHSFYGSPVK